VKLGEYADRVEDEHVCGRVPWELTAAWGRGWDLVLSLLERSAVHEHVALTFAKCEFLGGLLTGHGESNVTHALAYIRRFMPHYSPYHDLGRHKTAKSDLFNMLRNGPLHGVTPAGVHMDGQDEVIGWRIGEGPHLTSTADGSLRIVPSELRRDFVESVRQYADYLRQDAHDPSFAGLPTQRWRRSFWMRFSPAWYPTAKWEQEGLRRGVFPKF
jgi:hypothetical protein